MAAAARGRNPVRVGPYALAGSAAAGWDSAEFLHIHVDRVPGCLVFVAAVSGPGGTDVAR